jgi:16S rRNA processing protein RimM
MEDYLRVGVITTTHGVRGEVKVYPTTDDPKRFLDLKKLYLDTGKDLLYLELEGVKFFKQLVILKFKGIDNINDIEKYRGKDLLIDREDAVELQEGEYFIYDLIDSEVYTDEGRKLGTLTEIMTTAANDVYVVKTSEGKEVLIPSTREFILDVDVENKKIIVHLLKGMI